MLVASPSVAQRRRGAQGPAAPTRGNVPAPAETQSFESLSAQADAAREGDRVEEAVALYRRALSLRPQWGEGWWYLATLSYERDDCKEGARAFREATKLQPKVGAAWALLGLCEFRLGEYDEAFDHIQQGRRLGVGDNVELTRVMRFHEGLIANLKGDFERAQQTLGTLSFEGLKNEDLIIALGLAALRRGVLPRQIPHGYPDRDLVRRVGLAEHFAAQKNNPDAAREYELLARDYPKAPGVQYAYGRHLLANRDDEGALAAFAREIENYPKHALARLQIAYIKLKNRDPQAALPFAEEATRLHPRLPLSHFILGRALLETGQTARAIEELEAVQRMTPDYPPTYFQLARAYSKANRKADAERARETFARMNKQADDEAAQGRPRADAVPTEGAEQTGTTPPPER
jgi:tetratricopeptide (TPR) repeat protein